MIESARLPPIYRLIPVGPTENILERAKTMAAMGGDPASLLCADRTDILDCAILLHPDAELDVSQLVLYVGMLGLGDALGSVVPAGIDVTYRWPNVIEANAAIAARVGLSVPAEAGYGEIPPWLVLRATAAISRRKADGLTFETTLAEEGAVEVTVSELLESFSRHFLTWLGRWQDDGFAPVRAMWLRHAPSHGERIALMVGDRQEQGQFEDIADDGALLLGASKGGRRIALDIFFDR